MKKAPLGFVLFVASSIALTWIACGAPKAVAGVQESDFVGEWEAVAIQLTFTTENGGPSSRNVNVSEGEWETHMNRTAPQIKYLADHRYTSWYLSLTDAEGRQTRDSVIQKGTWALKGDTLSLFEPNLSIPNSQFVVSTKGDRMELNSTMDMDMDGQADDKYWLMQRRKK